MIHTTYRSYSYNLTCHILHTYINYRFTAYMYVYFYIKHEQQFCSLTHSLTHYLSVCYLCLIVCLSLSPGTWEEKNVTAWAADTLPTLLRSTVYDLPADADQLGKVRQGKTQAECMQYLTN